MSELLTAEQSRPVANRLRVVDCDVHPGLSNGLSDVYPYLSEPWRQRLLRKRAGGMHSNLTLRYLHPNGAVVREDARTPTGALGGTDPHFVVKDLLEANNIDIALLTSLQAGAVAAVQASVDESIVLTSAFNDYFLDHWLSVDRRFRYSLTIPVRDPPSAAAEIRRLGKHPQIAAIYLPPVNILLGHRQWWPVYEAAQDHDLPILVHVTGTDSIYNGAPVCAGGMPDTYVERYVTLTLAAEANLNSLVFSGVFERFPRLKFMFVEYGFLWVLPLLWRMDRTWRQLRHETPWVKRSPVDYVHAHCRFTTQPLDEPAEPRHLDRMIELMGYDLLCFSTDYPHWDNDMPGASLRTLPPAERQRIFADNAMQTLRLG